MIFRNSNLRLCSRSVAILLVALLAVAAKRPASAAAHSTATNPTTSVSDSPTPVPLTMPAPSVSTPLSWDEAVRTAHLQNADLRAAAASVEQNDALIKSALGNFLPTVSVSASVTKSNTAGNADPDSDSARLSFSENILNGFGDQARLDLAKRNREAVGALRDLAFAQVSASLKTTYQNLLIAGKNIALSNDIIARRKRNLDLVQLRFEGGRENKGSVLLSQANLDQAMLEKLQAANSVEASRVSLARVLGLDHFSYSDVSSVVPVSAPALEVDFESLAAQAPELRQAVANEQAAQAAVRVARQGFFPSLDLTGSLVRSGSSWFPTTDQAQVTLGLTIPLFEGGRSYFGVKGAQAAATNAAAARETALRSKVVSLRTAYNSYVEAVAREKVAQSFVTAAETRAEIGRSKYNTGLLSFEEWDIIENDLVTRQRNALSTQNERVSAEAAWDQAQGHGVFQ